MPYKRPDPIPFTKATFEKHQQNLIAAELLEKEILVRLQTAREMGDLSENGAYKYAKFELGNVRRKLNQLRFWLRYGVVTDKTQDQDCIGFGSEITVETNGKQSVFTLVTKHESNPMERKLSLESPLGTILIGKKTGDVVEFEAPVGMISYKIIKVS